MSGIERAGGSGFTEVAALAQRLSLREGSADIEAGLLVLKKALDAQSASALQLIESTITPAGHLGSTIDLRA